MTTAPEEFDGFYAAHLTAVVVQLHAYTGNRADAQEIAQEAFARAWQRWSVVAGYDDPLAWVRRVAFRLAVSRWRRARTALRFTARQRVESAPPPSPDHVALVAALAELPPTHRRAVVLHYLADVGVRAIAEQEGVAEATVRSWLHRGRAALATRLRDHPDEPAATPNRGAER